LAYKLEKKGRSEERPSYQVPKKLARCLCIGLFVYRPLMAPDWNDWGWKVDPKFLEEARQIWD
jgi:hypothetical protein